MKAYLKFIKRKQWVRDANPPTKLHGRGLRFGYYKYDYRRERGIEISRRADWAGCISVIRFAYTQARRESSRTKIKN